MKRTKADRTKQLAGGLIPQRVIDNNDWLNTVKGLRKYCLGLSQTELANLLGINASTVTRWETGTLKIEPGYSVKFEMLKEIGRLLIRGKVDGALIREVAKAGGYGVEVLYQKLLYERLIQRAPKSIDPKCILGPDGPKLKLTLIRLIAGLKDDNTQQVADFLVEYLESFDQYDRNGKTPLMAAAEKGFPRICSFLILKGAKVNARTYCGATALHFALDNTEDEDKELEERVAVINLLLEKNANPNALDETGKSPMLLAVKNMFPIEILKKLIFYKANLDFTSDKGLANSPLITAILQGTSEHAHLLIDAGCSLDYRDGNYGQTALHYAVSAGAKDIVVHLLDKGADASIANYCGETPAELSRRLKQPAITALFSIKKEVLK